MRKHRKQTEEINFWQSSTDLITGILLVLVLVIALLIFYMLHMSPHEHDYKDPGSEAESVLEYVDSYPDAEPVLEIADNHPENPNTTQDNGNGNGDDDGDGDEEEEFEYPEEGDGIKSAVYAMLVDGDTGRTVQEEGVPFSLHNGKGTLMVLNTYYPEKISYRDYDTREDGTFYLPEKIYEGAYFFRNIEPPEGYEKAEDVEFTLDDMYDWPEPYIVKIPVFPARNTITIHLTDGETGQSAGEGTYDVVAAEDITTLDGTVRYRKGEIVSQVTCGKDGDGESSELYLGKYILRETGTPEFYAAQNTEIPVELSRTGNDSEIMYERTAITIRAVDENTGKAIPGAEFSISDGDTETTATTDGEGEIILDEVKKDADYAITQVSVPEPYRLHEGTEKVRISRDGRINGEAAKELTVENRVIRTSFTVTDTVLKAPVEGQKVTLYTDAGDQVKGWTTNGAPVSFTDIEPGGYYVVIGTKEDRHYPVSVQDTGNEQAFHVSVMTGRDIGIMAGILGAAAIGVIAIIKAVGHIRRKRRERKEA